MYRELQRSCGWRLQSSKPCSGMDCISGVAHVFSYAAASSNIGYQRAKIPALEVKVAASGTVSSIQFVAQSTNESLESFWHSVCPPVVVRPTTVAFGAIGTTTTTTTTTTGGLSTEDAIRKIAEFDVAVSRVIMVLEEVTAMQVKASPGGLVRWTSTGASASAGASAWSPASLQLLMRFSTNPQFDGPASQFQVVFHLDKVAAGSAMSSLVDHCEVKCIFGAVVPNMVHKAIQNACDEQAHSFGCLTRVHEYLHALVTRSRC